MTLKEALAEGERLLKAPSPHASIDSPALDAALLLAEALKISREKLIVLGNEPMDDSDYESFLNLISKRLGGECIAYILGRKDFRYLSFTVNPEVLVPRPDTETLVEAALEYIDIFTEKSDKISLLDLCTGSGAVAISLKYERPNIKVTASDICIKALKTAAENAVCHNSTITFIESNLFENINGKFNIIVCNPPYIPSSELPALPAEVRREPKLALDGGKDGLQLIRQIIPEAKNNLLNNGVLLLEADPGQMPAIKSLLERNAYKEIKVYQDLSNQNRVISGIR